MAFVSRSPRPRPPSSSWKKSLIAFSSCMGRAATREASGLSSSGSDSESEEEIVSGSKEGDAVSMI